MGEKKWKAVLIRIDAELQQRVFRMAHERCLATGANCSQNAIFETAIQEYMDRHGTRKKP